MPSKPSSYQLSFDSDNACVVIEFDGYATSSEFRKGMHEMLQTLQENKVSQVLADVKDMVLIGSEDQKWFQSEFIASAAKVGLRDLCIIRPDSYFNKVAVERIVESIAVDSVALHIADDRESAYRWLNGDSAEDARTA